MSKGADAAALQGLLAGTEGMREMVLEGMMHHWVAEQAMRSASPMIEGIQLFGAIREGVLALALTAAAPIGAGTTIWIDIDGNSSTGHLLWEWAVGAEYRLELTSDLGMRLSEAGADPRTGTRVSHVIGAEGRSLEIAVPLDLLDGAVGTANFMADINDSVFLPEDYGLPGYRIASMSETPADFAPAQRIGIVFSESTAAAFYSPTAYHHLMLAAQSQALSAGLPFDLLGEADLVNLDALSAYDVLVFPAFSHAPANHEQIVEVLAELSYGRGVALVAAGDFMTTTAQGDPIAPSPYTTMRALLGVTPEAWPSDVDIAFRGNPHHPVTAPISEIGEWLEYEGGHTAVFAPIDPERAQVLVYQDIGDRRYPATVATVTGGRNLHFATPDLLVNSFLLGATLQWITKRDDGPGVALNISRHDSVFASRVDMDVSSLRGHINRGIYDRLLPIFEDWKARYDFVGSLYVNVGRNPPDVMTDWDVSIPYYRAFSAMGHELGSHTYTHPMHTDLLLPDLVSEELLESRAAAYEALGSQYPGCFLPVCLTDTVAPDVIERAAGLTTGEVEDMIAQGTGDQDTASDPLARAVAEASVSFQFGRARDVLEARLGIDFPGAAVPGNPETPETATRILAFHDYLSGGAAVFGSSFSGPLGFMVPGSQDVYFAPNLSFDFTLAEWQGLSPQAAQAAWETEIARIARSTARPVYVWPWHDYGPTEWEFIPGEGSLYSREMFEGVLERAASMGSEFVTLLELAHRLVAFQQATLAVSPVSRDEVIVSVTSPDGGLGTFALDVSLDEGQTVSAVEGWYAYGADRIYLDDDGGDYVISAGLVPADVTRVVRLPQRTRLLSLVGDGRALTFEVEGGGLVELVVGGGDAQGYEVQGAQTRSSSGSELVLWLEGEGIHRISVAPRPGDVPQR